METINTSGRRKAAVARAYMSDGKGNVTVNKKDYKDFFPVPTLQYKITQPFAITETLGQYDVIVNVDGGGLTGQADACAHGISRALVKSDEANRKPLRTASLLTRDSRMVESKKYGKRKARRGQQFSKR